MEISNSSGKYMKCNYKWAVDVKQVLAVGQAVPIMRAVVVK